MKAQVKDDIGTGVKLATAAGVVGAFTVDMPALIGIWSVMFVNIAVDHNRTLSKAMAKNILGAVAAQSAAWMGGSAVLTKILTYSGIATWAGVGLNCLINGFYTYRLGKIFDKMLSSNDDLTSVAIIAKVIVMKLVPIPTLGEIKDFWHMYKLFAND